MTKEELKKEAKQLFETTSHNVLYGNPKGEFFTSEQSGNPTLKEGETLHKFERSEFVKAADAAEPLKAEQAIEAIGKATTLEELKPFEADKRATVKKAYDAKLAELNKA